MEEEGALWIFCSSAGVRKVKEKYHAILSFIISRERKMGKILQWLKECIKRRTKPASSGLIINLLSDLTRSHAELVVENALLRQQLIVLNRQIKRPQLTNLDRFRLVFLSHFTAFWKQALHIVQPDTLVRWHRELFSMYWRRKSHGKQKISPETIVLIEKMAGENQLWGAERIRGELLKLGIEASKRTTRGICQKAGRNIQRATIGQHS